MPEGRTLRLDGHFVLSDELLRDAEADIQRVVGDAAGRAIATLLASYLATGTGSSQPEGVTVGAAAGVTAASATSVTLDEIKELFYSVLPGARKNGVFVGSSDLTLSIASLKNDAGDYVWSPAAAADESDRLFGKPYYEDAAFSSMAANNVPMVFGDLANYYWIRIVTRGQNGGGIQLDFSQEPGFTSFLTYARWALWCDARVMGTGGEIKKLTMAAS